MYVHAMQSTAHRPGFAISTQHILVIGRHSLTSIVKVKAMAKYYEFDIKKLKIRGDFDYRGMKDKMRQSFTHVHHIEDV